MIHPYLGTAIVPEGLNLKKKKTKDLKFIHSQHIHLYVHIWCV